MLQDTPDHLLRFLDKLDLAADLILPALAKDIGHDFTALNRVADPHDHVGARGRAVGGDGDCLLAHPLRCDAHGGDVAYVVAQSTLLHHLGKDGENAAVVHTGTQVQNWRHTSGFAHLAQAWAGPLKSCLAEQIAVLAAGDGTAAGLDQKHVVLEQFAHQVVMGGILGSAGVVTTDVGHHAADAASHNGIV